MNPELPTPQLNQEYRAPTPENGELLPNPEMTGERSHEHEQSMRQVDRQTAPPPPPSTLPLPAPAVASPPVVAPPTDDSVGPTLAGDDDLIEKEWVDKAKTIITETQNDPYRREQEVNKLQVDYLRKRYGKELGTSN